MKSVPNTTGIAWIPFMETDLSTTNPQLHESMSRLDKLKRLFVYSIFKLGNPEPDGSIFQSRETFITWLEKKEYRAALGLWDIRRPQNSNGEFEVDTLPGDLCVGYTPYHKLGMPFLRLFLPGNGWSGWNEFESTKPDVVAFGRFVVFRIGNFGRIAARVVAGISAQYLRLSINYELDMLNNKVHVHCNATVVPNHIVVSENKGVHSPVSQHDMLRWNAVEVMEILDCDEGGHAPYRHFGTYSTSI